MAALVAAGWEGGVSSSRQEDLALKLFTGSAPTDSVSGVLTLIIHVDVSDFIE